MSEPIHYTVHEFPKRFGLVKPLWISAVWRDGLIVGTDEFTNEADADAAVARKWPTAVKMPSNWRPWSGNQTVK